MFSVLLPLDRDAVISDRRIIPSAERQVIVNSQRVLDRAGVIAQRIADDAAEALLSDRKLAREMGFQQGRAEAIAALTETVWSRQRELRRNESVIIETVLYLLAQILQSEPQIHASRVASLLRESGAREWVRFRASPKGAEILAAARWPESFRVEFISDPTLNDGDCVLETDFGAVDGLLEPVLSSLRTMLESTLSSNPPNSANESH